MNVLTFDIEEWYIYNVFPKGGPSYYLPMINEWLERLLDFLEEQGKRATFFCLGEVARSNPEVLKKIAAGGHELGCHSNRHQILKGMTSEGFRNDLHAALDSMEQLLGRKVELYRAPAFSITPLTAWALEVLVQEGIRYDCSLFPLKRRGGGWPGHLTEGPLVIHTASGPLYEFPMSCANIGGMQLVFSGGGYFRLFPYPLIKRLTLANPYNMTYFHIRDFDRKQKRIYSLSYFQSYYGVKGAFSKFCKYVKDFDFVTVGEAAKQINWQQKWVFQ